jgi:hypothetical protein
MLIWIRRVKINGLVTAKVIKPIYLLKGVLLFCWGVG